MTSQITWPVLQVFEREVGMLGTNVRKEQVKKPKNGCVGGWCP